MGNNSLKHISCKMFSSLYINIKLIIETNSKWEEIQHSKLIFFQLQQPQKSAVLTCFSFYPVERYETQKTPSKQVEVEQDKFKNSQIKIQKEEMILL